jgi:hypothetical protein
VLRRKRDREEHEHEAKFKMIKTTLIIKEKTLNMVEKRKKKRIIVL